MLHSVVLLFARSDPGPSSTGSRETVPELRQEYTPSPSFNFTSGEILSERTFGGPVHVCRALRIRRKSENTCARAMDEGLPKTMNGDRTCGYVRFLTVWRVPLNL